MSLKSYSSKCIKKYLMAYNMKLKHSYETDKNAETTGDLYIKLDVENVKIGHLHYSIDESANLHIDMIRVNRRNKPSIPIKITKILLLYLLSKHTDDVQTATLTALPSNDQTKIGNEFCLICFYQQLGFDPIAYDSKKMVDKCVRKIKKIDPDYDKRSDMCILCECQKNDIIFTKIDLRYLRVDMKALLPNLIKLLDIAYNDINESC
uniref:Uncharacterized protein n=1 Tax=viral metagenome TaxID=1070528 RepID=A0A6C0KCV5_9ZZZZ